MLNANHYNTIMNVVQDTQKAIENNELYEPNRKLYKNTKVHKIKNSTLDFHLIAKMKEQSSFRTTAGVYNALIRAPMGLPPIGYTAIYNAISRSNHVKVKTETIYQASDDNLVWVRARFDACSQLLVRFGASYPENTSGMKVSDPKWISRYEILKHNLGLTMYQIAWWDEKHIKQVVGEFREYTYQFGFDEDGNSRVHQSSDEDLLYGADFIAAVN